MPLNVVYTAPVGETSVTWGNGLPAVPVAEFIGTPTTGTAPLAVTFTNQSTGAIDSYLWSFGDGTTSTTANPTKAYLTAASFTVALTATGPGGSSTKTRTGYVVSSASGPPPPPPPVLGATITSLSAYASAPVTAPYSATVLPLRGTVPSGSTLRSTDDTTMRASILSTHDDGSAAVVVVSGSKTFAAGSSTISLQTSTATDTPLTVSAITTLISSLTVEFGGGFGTATATVASPEREWWKNGSVYCARYRLPAPNPGSTALESVIDVHAYAGRALVEMTVENGKVDAVGTPVAPASAAYVSAVLKVNGSTAVTLTLPPRGTRLDGVTTAVGTEYAVLSFAFGGPPGSPATGAAYAIWQSGTTGDFAGRGGQIATWNGSAWVYTPAATGALAQQPGDWPRMWTGSVWTEAHPGTHEAFRAGYASAWVGGAAPGVRVTQSVTDLQKHPLLWKMSAASSADLSGYASDTYAPFFGGRQRAVQMGGGGDHPSIGPLPQWGARALQSGDYRTWQAVEAADLSCLGMNIAYRHATGSNAGLVPCVNETGNRSRQTGWPGIGNNAEAMQWKDSHHPAAGFMGFISRPSPVFIELAQRVALYVGTTYSDNDGGPTKAIGVFVASYQTRAQAWGMRSLGHATFLTPDGQSWKSGGQASIAANVAHFDEWRTSGSQTALAIIWENRVDRPISRNTGNTARVNIKPWQLHYFLAEMAKVASARVAGSANQTALDTFTDWALQHPVKWINDQKTTGAWRYVPEMLVLGNAGQVAPSMTNAADYATQRATWMTESPVATVAGLWQASSTDGVQTYATGWVNDTSADVSRATYLWPALCAAVDRGVTGAALAYNHVLDNLTSLATWLNGFASDPRYGATPRNPPPPSGFATGGGTGSYNSTTKVWTPAKAVDGRVYAESWAIVPSGEWVEGAGSNISALSAEIIASGRGWGDSTLAWNAVMNAWNGFAIDTANSRVWLAAAGGHADSSNNGVYEFEAFKMAWRVLRLPSDRAAWTTQYKTLASPQPGTYTFNYESSVATPQAAFSEEAATATIRKYYFDQLFWDAQPTSRHVYSTVEYAPDKNELICGCRSLWRFDLDTNTWTLNRRYPNNVDGAENRGMYDEVTGDYLFSGMGDGIRNNYTYDTDADSFTGFSAPWGGGEGVIDTRYGRDVTVWQPPFSDRNTPLYWKYNLDSRTTTASGTCQYGGGLTAADYLATSSGADGAGMVYIPSLNRYWILYRMVGGLRWIELDPTTTPWTLRPLTFTGTLPTTYDKPCRKIVWMPALNAVLFANHDTRGFFIYKF